MGDHYSDARQAHEDRLHAEEAKRKGMSPYELTMQQKHEQKMRAGRMALEKQLRDQNDITYYQEHKNDPR